MQGCGYVFSGLVVGTILGNPLLGVVVGATIHAMYIGVISIGVSTPADSTAGVIFGTAFACALGLSAAEAVTLAVPFAVIGAFINPFKLSIGTIWYDRITASFKKRKIAMAYVWAVIGMIVTLSILGALAFVALYYGQNAFDALFSVIPTWATAGMGVIGKTMQALGISLGVSVLSSKKNYLAYFILAFFIVVEFGLGTLPMVIFAICLVIILGSKDGEIGTLDPVGATPVEAKFTSGELVHSALTYMQFFAWGMNFNTFSAGGQLFAMVPVMKKLYPGNVDKQCDEILKYDCYYHTTPQLNGFIEGATIALEEQRAAGVDINPEDIIAIRTGLMGPLAGVGDPLIQGVFGVIIASISVSMGIAGNILGAWFYLIMNVALMVFMHAFGVIFVYKRGSSIIEKLVSSGILGRIMDAAQTVGLIAFGALAAQVVSVGFGITFNIGSVALDLQATLFDAIIPKLVPFALCLTCIRAKNKGTSTMKIMVIMLICSFVGGALGILA